MERLTRERQSSVPPMRDELDEPIRRALQDARLDLSLEFQPGCRRDEVAGPS